MNRYFFVFFILSLIFSCKSKQDSRQTELTPLQDFASKNEIIDGIYKKKTLANVNDSLTYRAWMYALKTKSYTPILDSEEKLEKVRFIFETAKHHGLEKIIQPYLLKLPKIQEKVQLAQLTKEEQINAEIEFRNALHEYAKALQFGVLNPSKVLKYEYYIENKEADSTWHFNQFQIKDYLGHIDSLKVENPLYQHLQKKYQTISEFESGMPLPKPKKKYVKVGHKYEGVPILRKRFHLNEVSDTASNYLVYDQEIAEKIKEIQREHALQSDGIIGTSTLRMLNITNDELKVKIEAVLERLRWNNGQKYENAYIVNIPEFKLYVMENGKLIQTHEIGVGLANGKHHTPEFIDTLEYIVVNPKWTLPYSIATTEILPKVQADVTFLDQKNYGVYLNGEKLSPYTIHWQEYNVNNFPYTLIQEPGPGNALGRIKFIFPNQFHIYLHDTPSRHLFSRSMRAMSHGCVRVKNPFLLGDFVMENDQDYLNAKESTENRIFKVKKKYPVIFGYVTVVINEKGELRFVDDIYGKDKILQEAWQKWKIETKN